MAYKLTETDLILRLRDNATIPPEPTLIDYQEYQDWLNEGNTPLPADPLPTPTPSPTPDDKLAALGLTVDDLKQLLGIS